MPVKIVIFSILSSLFLTASPSPSDMPPDTLLQRGRDNYRAGQYAAAVDDLKNAAQGFLSADQMQRYVQTGTLETLPQFETALVYLALAQSKLGRDDDARETILRLSTAERIDETYADLPLEADVADFEPLTARLVPSMTLTPNIKLAQIRSGMPAPAPVEVVVAPPPAPVETPASVQTGQTKSLAVQPAMAQELQNEQKKMEARIAAECAAIQRAADEKIAAERAASEKAAAERIAAETAAIQRAADERIAAERAAIQRSADERIAAERAAAERDAAERIAAERAAVERAAQDRVVAAEAETRRTLIMTLRQADAYADSGQVEDASNLYVRLANAEGAPREAIAGAAVGLYRTGEFPEAVRAFRRLGQFARGEEDLRYYNAVSLYETGNYTGAKKELACALPFIQVTDDVSRYRMKIEQTATQQAMR